MLRAGALGELTWRAEFGLFSPVLPQLPQCPTGKSQLRLQRYASYNCSHTPGALVVGAGFILHPVWVHPRAACGRAGAVYRQFRQRATGLTRGRGQTP